MEIKNPPYFGKLLHDQGFRVWTLYMFRQLEGREFIEEDLHDGLFQVFQDIYDLKETRQNINVPPRSGKTSLAKYFIAYALAVNPKCNFIYTSFSQDLLNDISRSLAGILQHPIYQAMYDSGATEEIEETNPIDEFWKDYLVKDKGKATYSSRKIITKQGGVILFNSIGAALTGFGASVRGSKEFSGGLFCFPYEEEILTNKGRLKIGDIVENKLDVKVYSYNHGLKKIELKEIEKYFKNPESDIVEIKYKGGSIRCTPDHKVYTRNRGYVEAKDLSPNDVLFKSSHRFELINTNIKLFTELFSRNVFIKKLLEVTFRKTNTFFGFVVDTIFCVPSPILPPFNFQDRRRGKIVFPSYIRHPSSMGGYFPGFSNVNFSSRPSRSKRKSSVSNGILHIIGLSAIGEVFQPIIRRIAIKMTCFNTLFLRPNKGPHNKSTNLSKKRFIVFSKINFVPTFRKTWIKPLFLKGYHSPILSAARGYISFATNYISFIGNFINPLISRDVSPLFINYIGHCDNTYCLTVKDNHNLFVGASQPLLVSNCDDANKPADIRSQLMRTKVHSYYEVTLLSRLNDSNTPVVNIQQRLHLEDLSGFLESVYQFKTLKRPLVVDGICQLPSQYTPKRIEELKKNEFMFVSQYQQEPVLEGGNLFKANTIREFRADQMPQKYDWRFVTADLAYKDKESNDFVVFAYWGIKKEIVNDRARDHLYLIDVMRRKIESVEVEKWIDSWLKDKISYGFRYIWVEDKSHGIYLNQLYRKKGYPIPTEEMLKETLPRDRDKVERANNVIPCLDSIVPNMTFNTDIPDYDELKQELLAFSNSKHDDFVDNVIDGIKIGLFTADIVSEWEQLLG